jgi:hypothetical protein
MMTEADVAEKQGASPTSARAVFYALMWQLASPRFSRYCW